MIYDIDGNPVESGCEALEARVDIIEQNFGKFIHSVENKLYRISVDTSNNMTAIPVIPRKYICVGNSITMHSASPSVGWYVDDRSMAASRVQYDWPHRLLTYFQQTEPTCQLVDQFNFSVWEKNPQSRASYLPQLDSHGFDSTIDLVCIQLGENVSDTTTFEADYIALVEYVQTLAPNAYIVLVGDSFQSTTKVTIEQNVSASINAGFANMTDYWNIGGYANHIGGIIYKSDGTSFEITDAGVAMHPSDKGFRCIAQQVLRVITGDPSIVLQDNYS